MRAVRSRKRSAPRPPSFWRVAVYFKICVLPKEEGPCPLPCSRRAGGRLGSAWARPGAKVQANELFVPKAAEPVPLMHVHGDRGRGAPPGRSEDGGKAVQLGPARARGGRSRVTAPFQVNHYSIQTSAT